jgi:hypothetical protein
LARIIRPSPPKPKSLPQTAAKKIKLGSSGPGAAGSSSGGGGGGGGGGGTKGKAGVQAAEKEVGTGGAGGRLYAGLAIGFAVLAVFVAKVIATLFVQ